MDEHTYLESLKREIDSKEFDEQHILPWTNCLQSNLLAGFRTALENTRIPVTQDAWNVFDGEVHGILHQCGNLKCHIMLGERDFLLEISRIGDLFNPTYMESDGRLSALDYTRPPQKVTRVTRPGIWFRGNPDWTNGRNVPNSVAGVVVSNGGIDKEDWKEISKACVQLT